MKVKEPVMWFSFKYFLSHQGTGKTSIELVIFFCQASNGHALLYKQLVALSFSL